MKLIFDISHPAHFHLFKNTIKTLSNQGNEIKIIGRKKDVTLKLLSRENIEYECLSEHKPGILNLASELFIHQYRLLKIIKEFKPDAIIEAGGTFIAHVGKLTRTPTIVFYNNENAKLQNFITFPFVDVLCTPKSFMKDYGRKHIKFKSYHELAYLHPNRFKPDPGILEELGIKEGDFYSIVRFVGWSSSHDINKKGFSDAGKVHLVNKLLNYGKVFISSEGELPDTLNEHRYELSEDKLHHLMAYSSILVGESATMASESACLGVPSIYFSTSERGYTNEQERLYGLVFNFINKNENDVITKTEELANSILNGSNWIDKKNKLISENEDLTSWIVKFILDYVDQEKYFQP